MSLKSQIKNLLKSEGIFTAKKLGQHFLVSEKILDYIVQSAELTKKDYVVEVGSGIGNLTEKLCQKARWVIGVEVDKKMVQILKKRLTGIVNFKIVEKNILALNLDEILSQVSEYKVVANLPYYISQPTIRYFLERVKKKPKLMVLMLQKEVAEKVCAQPPNMSLLSVAVQFYAKTKYLKTVPAKFFWPTPKVDSAIVKIWKINYSFEKFDREKIETDFFFKMVKAAFLNKRKQLKNSLSALFHCEAKIMERILQKAKISPSDRPQNLKIEDWLRLYSQIRENE